MGMHGKLRDIGSDTLDVGVINIAHLGNEPRLDGELTRVPEFVGNSLLLLNHMLEHSNRQW